jgi:hypothetical protein
LTLLQSETAKSFSFARWPFFFLFTTQTEEDVGEEPIPGGGEEGDGRALAMVSHGRSCP